MNTQILLVMLIGTVHLSQCEHQAIDLQVVKPEKSEPATKIDETESADDKSVHKRRTYYGGNGDRDYGGRDTDYDRFMDYGSKRKVYMETESEKNFDRRDKMNWDMGDRNGRMSFGSAKDRFGGPMSDESFYGRPGSLRGDYYEDGRQSRITGEGKFRGSLYQDGMTAMNKVDSRQQEFVTAGRLGGPRDFNAPEGTVGTFRPRFGMGPGQVGDYPFGSEYPYDGTDLYNDKSIVINLQSDCPFPKHTKGRFFYKYSFGPKAHGLHGLHGLHHPSPLLPNNLFSADPALQYL